MFNVKLTIIQFQLRQSRVLISRLGNVCLYEFTLRTYLGSSDSDNP